MKTTKAQARACYDDYFGTLRCLNGGTREENIRMAPRCREELEKIVAKAAALAANPSKLLAADEWLMRALREDIPNNFAAFNRNYPATPLAEVVQFPASFSGGQTVRSVYGEVLTVAFQQGVAVTMTNGSVYHHTKLFAADRVAP
jgi:hypothetical protein